MTHPLGKTRPRPLLSSLHQTGSERIPLDITANPEEMMVGRDGEGLEAPLIYVSGAGRSAPGVPTFAVGYSQPEHEGRQLPITRGPQHQVEVVRHEAIGETAHRHALLSLREKPQEGGVVSGLIKEAHPPYPPIENMKHQSA